MNVIKIPGFGDAGGIKQDNAILHQIQNLLLASDEQSALYLDAICFVVKALDTRLTSCQKYMFHSVMSLFGKDLETNICTLITFCDGTKPPVLASLKELKLPFGQSFTFNNSALFAENNVDNDDILSSMFWKMGCNNFEQFFQFIWVVERKSILQTKHVFDKREELKTIIENMRSKISAGLAKLAKLKILLNHVQEHKKNPEDNSNYEYTVNETRQVMITLPKGMYAMSCLYCNVYCHKNCTIEVDNNKEKCDAMDRNGKCTVCPRKCHWSNHKSSQYIFENVTVPVTRYYPDIKKRIEKVHETTSVQEKVFETLVLFSDVNELSENISHIMNNMNHCKKRLKEIELISHPSSDVEHIDLLILTEEREKQPGYNNRIKLLKDMKTYLDDQNFDAFSEQLKDAKESMKSIMGRYFEKDKKGGKEEAEKNFLRGKVFKKLFS